MSQTTAANRAAFQISTLAFMVALPLEIPWRIYLSLQTISENQYLENGLTQLAIIYLRDQLFWALIIAIHIALGAMLVTWLVQRLSRAIENSRSRQFAHRFAILYTGILTLIVYVLISNLPHLIPYHLTDFDLQEITGGILLVLVYLLAILSRPLPTPRRLRWFGGALGITVVTSYFGLLLLAPTPAASQPNILLIVMDTVRQSNLSVYGYERDTAPNISRLAREGAVFENAFSVSPWTMPSHASMFTGLYPLQHATTQETPWLRAQQTTLAEILANEGYKTAAFVNNAIQIQSLLWMPAFSVGELAALMLPRPGCADRAAAREPLQQSEQVLLQLRAEEDLGVV